MRHPSLLHITIFVIIFLTKINAEASTIDSYRIGINDVLEIKVLDYPDLRTIATVADDGSISFPYIGTVHVKGMRLEEIEKVITKRLSDGYIKYPIVSVSLMKSFSKRVFVYGDVRRVGEVLFEERMTVVRAITLAGGTDGLYGRVTVRRLEKGSSEYKDITLSLKDIIEGNPAGDMLLQADDILIVEKDKIFIYGEVGRTGEFPFEKDITVIRALSIAGGTLPTGVYGKVKVRRKQKGGGDKYEDIEIDLKGTIEGSISSIRGDMLLQHDDIIIVERNKTFFIQGEVNKVGEFVLEKDMTVARAISVAGGVNQNGLYGKVRVRRKQEGTLKYKDIIEMELNKGVIEVSEGGDMLLQPDDIVIVERNRRFFVHGEVGSPGEYVLTEDTTVVRAISKAGGITLNGLYGKVKVRRKQEGEPGYKDIEIGLKGTIESNIRGDMLLQHDDILIVERNKTFFVYGEVNNPGQYVLEENMTVFKALSLAGGFTKWGSSKKVEILRPTDDKIGYARIKVNIDDIIKGKTSDILLNPGDTIVVSTGIF